MTLIGVRTGSWEFAADDSGCKAGHDNSPDNNGDPAVKYGPERACYDNGGDDHDNGNADPSENIHLLLLNTPLWERRVKFPAHP
jgi:hypothetical protein